MNRYGVYGATGSVYAIPSPYRNEELLPAPLSYGQSWANEATQDTLSFGRDADTLAQMLTPVDIPQDSPIADQLFGGQSRQLRFSLEHFVNLLNERGKLHKRHIADINHRHMHVQGRLFGARLHGRLDGYKNATRFEQMIAQLDEQKRREELQFWKDSMEVRELMFEAAKEYHALSHRAALFRGLEPVGVPYA